MAKKTVVPEMRIDVLKIGSCLTLSGKSTLTYHLGRHDDLSVHFRVVQNSGKGQFNSDWVALTQIEMLLAKHPAEKPMSSSIMHPVFQGKSSNSPAFLFAVIKAEGLVTASEVKDGGYLIGDLDLFKKQMSALIAAGTDLSAPADTPPEPSGKKRTGKGAE